MSASAPQDPHDLLAQRAAARQRLNRAWLLSLGLAAVAWIAMFQVLRQQWPPSELGGWLLVSALALFYEWRIFKQALPLWHGQDEATLRAALDPDARLTLVAGVGYALVAGMLLLPTRSGPVDFLFPGLGLLALIADALAQTWRQRHSATLGSEYLAQEFRALGALVLTAAAIHAGKLDSWFLAIGIMPYLLLFTQSWLSRQQKPIPTIPHHTWRDHFQYGYMAGTAVYLFPWVGQDFARPTSLLFGLPFFLIALRDWFILTGMLDPNQSQYRQIMTGLQNAMTGWLALTVRLFAGVVCITLLADMVFQFHVYVQGFGGPWVPGMAVLLLLVPLPFLILGIKTRLAALIALAPLTAILLVMGWHPVPMIGWLLLGLTAIIGPGRYAVFRELFQK